VAIADLEPASIDLSTTDLFHDGPPHEAFRVLRDREPVHWNPPNPRWVGSRDPGGFWSITKAADISAVARDSEGTSVNEGILQNGDEPLPVEVMRTQLTGMDPPRHTKYRKLLTSAFTARAVAAQGEAIRARTTKLLDAMMDSPDQDFVRDFAALLPSQVIADMLGFPPEMDRQFHIWTNDILDMQNSGAQERAARAFREIDEYTAELVEQRLREPREDLLTRLLFAEEDGDRLDPAELGSFVTQMIVAGNDTTLASLAGGVWALSQHPEQWSALRHDPSVMRNAVEEIIRWVSPILYTRRTATRDFQLRDKKISAGDKLIQWFVSGNRDEELNDNPQIFDIRRDNVKHVSFGGGGFRLCIGATLSRLELKIALEELAARVEHLNMTKPPIQLESSFMASYQSMPVRFDIQLARS
jgi:cytochrome P450